MKASDLNYRPVVRLNGGGKVGEVSDLTRDSRGWLRIDHGRYDPGGQHQRYDLNSVV